MKPNMGHTTLVIIFMAALYTIFVVAAQADDRCSTAKAAGDWGLTLTGTLILPAGPVPGAAVATLNADKAGNITGNEARNVGGGFANETITGSWTVNPDCTGMITANIYELDVLVRTSVLSLVFDQNSTEIRMLQQSLTLPDGTTIPVVITVQGRKMVFEGDHE